MKMHPKSSEMPVMNEAENETRVLPHFAKCIVGLIFRALFSR